MDLEKVAANIRPRNPWEATDLGVTMLQRWWKPVYLAWLVVVLPIFVLLFSLLPLGWAIFIAWWLLPFFDRVPLFVISRALFGATPGVWASLRELPRLWSRGFFMALTFGRLSPFRAFHLPVAQLEGLRSSRYFKRCEVLRSTSEQAALGLTACALLVSCCLVMGFYLAIQVMLPEPLQEELARAVFLSDAPVDMWVKRLVFGAVLFLAFSIIEPLHVAAGFALYLNRRTHLEGWDIELTFRRMAERIKESRRPKSPKKLANAVMFLLVFLGPGLGPGLGLGLLPTLPAQDMQEQDSQQSPEKVVAEVLAQPDFGGKKTETRWVWRWERESTTSSSDGPLVGSNPMGAIFSTLLWIGAVIAGAMLIRLIVRHVSLGARPSREQSEAPEMIFGLDIRPESLPESPAEEAWRLWQQGDAAGCLSLLYRAALAELVNVQNLRIVCSSTEGDCLRLVREIDHEEQSTFFAKLTHSWQNCAYAHRLPEEEQARSLCNGFPQFFGRDTKEKA